MRVPWGELWRFGLSGAANTILAYGVYAVLILAQAHYSVALAGDYLFAVLFSLVVNKVFTFRHQGPLRWSMFASMAATYAGLFGLNWALAYLLIDVARLDPLVSQALATVVIGGASFLLQRNFVFGRNRER